MCVTELNIDYRSHQISEEERNKYQAWIDSLEALPYQFRITKVRKTELPAVEQIIFSCDLFHNDLYIITAMSNAVHFYLETGKGFIISQDAETIDTISPLKKTPTITYQEAAEIGHKELQYINCYTAQLCYANLSFNFLESSNIYPPNYALTWKISPKGSKRYEYALINAETGELIFTQTGL